MEINHIYVKKKKKRRQRRSWCKDVFLVGNSTEVINLSLRINMTMMKTKKDKLTTACDYNDSP